MKKGFVVEIDWSQTDKTKIFVPGAKTMEEAIATVKKTTDCLRVYGCSSVDRILEEVNTANTITIDKEEYLRLRVAAERDERFFDWDISCNWSDYGNALYSTEHDNGEVEITIDDWEANLRKEIFGNG